MWFFEKIFLLKVFFDTLHWLLGVKNQREKTIKFTISDSEYHLINRAAFCSMAGQIPMLHFPARATGGHVDNTANRWQDTREIFSPNWVENWHPDMYRSFPSIYQEKTEWKIFSLMHIITCLVILQFLFTTTNIFQLLSIWELICMGDYLNFVGQK